MLTIRTLGGLSVEGAGGTFGSLAKQPRRLALLAVVPIGPDRTVSRDKLIDLFWMERDAEHARGALAQVMYVLRKELDEPSLFLGDTALSLNPDLVNRDALEFERDLDRGAVEQAVARYSGAFLDGFFISGAPNFEQWVDGERSRLEHRYRKALETLAARATDEGAHKDAAGWWRRIAALDPLSTDVALRVMTALARAGNRAGALEHARLYESSLRTEYDAEPDPAVRALAERLRREAAPVHVPTPDRHRASEGERLRPTTVDKSAMQGAIVAERYVIRRVLGHGSLATVYLADDRQHDRQVAIKFVAQDLSDIVSRQRFEREIAILARLQHPHILPLYESGEVGGALYYVMPFVDGQTVMHRLEREHSLPIDEALAIALEVAGALTYAHEQGIVHRDIKPANILLSSSHALLSDFGVARALIQAGGQRLTDSGYTVGTPMYMSPEQASGDPVDARSDQFSLACVLFEMLAGQPPFESDGSRSALASRLMGPPLSLRRLRPSVFPEVALVVERALATAPADRYSTVSVFADALASAMRAHQEQPDQPTRTRRWWRALGR